MATAPASDARRPSRWRLIPELASLVSIHLRDALTRWPKQPPEGAKLLVIPGFLANDRSTSVLRKHLARAGYRVWGWELGLNRGVREDTLEKIVAHLERIAGGEKVTLIGWSLGGLYAREAAKHRPELVDKVVTLGAAFSGDRKSNNVWRLYELVAGHSVEDPPVKANLPEKPPVRTIALWSRNDGMVDPASTRGEPSEADEAVEVACTHMGFVADPRAIAAIIEAVRR